MDFPMLHILQPNFCCQSYTKLDCGECLNMKSIIYEEYHIVSSPVDCLGPVEHRLEPHMTRTIEKAYKCKIRLIICQSSSIPSFSLLQHHIDYESI